MVGQTELLLIQLHICICIHELALSHWVFVSSPIPDYSHGRVRLKLLWNPVCWALLISYSQVPMVYVGRKIWKLVLGTALITQLSPLSISSIYVLLEYVHLQKVKSQKEVKITNICSLNPWNGRKSKIYIQHKLKYPLSERWRKPADVILECSLI